MAYTKIGPHYMGGNDKGQEYTQHSGCTVVVLVNGFADAERIVNLPHRPMVIGRVSRDDAKPEDMVLQVPAREAAAWFVTQFIDPQIAANPAIGWWIALNEPITKTRERMQWVDEYNWEFAIQMQARGKQAVLGNWSVGNPPREMWAHAGRTLQATRELGAVIGLHRYLALRRWLDGSLDIGGTVNGFWGTYHETDLADFRAQGYAPLVAFTEAGLENLDGGQPWRTENISAWEYAQILHAWDMVLRREKQVVGAAVFTVGVGGAVQWLPYDVGNSQVLQHLQDYAQVQTPPPTLPPVPQGTHTVAAPRGVNVRLFPWLGKATPPAVKTLVFGAWVKVHGEYKGWAQIGADGNEWVRADLLKAA